jgi:hypothetical protein
MRSTRAACACCAASAACRSDSLALVRPRQSPQAAAQRGVELLLHERAFAPGQRQHQPQHGRCGHPRHRGAEGQAQTLHRRTQGAAQAGKVGAGVQGLCGATQRQQQAAEGAQHAQQDQQAGERRRQAAARQGDPLGAIEALLHGRAQCRRHARQPIGRRAGQRQRRVERRAQASAGAAHLRQVPAPQQEERADQDAHAQGHRMVPGGSGAGRGQGQQAGAPGRAVQGV